MGKIVDRIIAERTVIGVILLNSLALCMLAFTQDRTPLDSIWFAIDYACVVYFVVEVALKVGRFGWRDYWKGGWNRFDFAVTVVSLPVLLSPFVDLHGFGVVLLLRMGRLLRMLRVLVFIPNRDHLVEGITRALKASVGVFLALLLINVILAVGASILFGRLAPEHFGDPFISFYSIFQVFTVEGWNEIPAVLASRADQPGLALLARLYFAVAVLVGGILGLSLANAVFVDEMTTDNTLELEVKVDELNDKMEALRAEIRSLRAELVPGSGETGPAGES
jgi:voltage-gated sodium channel